MMKRRLKFDFEKHYVIYMKTDGTIFVRERLTSPLDNNMSIGDYTGMGWKIIDVMYTKRQQKQNYIVSLAQGTRFRY